MTEYIFQKVHFKDYSSLNINDRLIVDQGNSFTGKGTMVSGIVEKLTPAENIRIIHVKFTDKRPEYIEQQLVEYREGNSGNIMYRVSENVLKGGIPFLLLLEEVIKSENAEEDLRYVCSHLNSALRNSKLSFR